MAGSVIWSIPALKELSNIRKYLTRKASPKAATRVTQQIVSAVRRLEEFPDSGRIVPEYNRPDIREVLVSRYRVIYRRTFGATEVVHVVNGRRNLLGRAFKDLRKKKPPRR